MSQIVDVKLLHSSWSNWNLQYLLIRWGRDKKTETCKKRLIRLQSRRQPSRWYENQTKISVKFMCTDLNLLLSGLQFWIKTRGRDTADNTETKLFTIRTLKLFLWLLQGGHGLGLVQSLSWLMIWSCLTFWFSSSGLGMVSPSAMSVSKEDGTNSPDDATDEIMDRLVKSVTQNPSDRPSSPKTRKRSRLNRKSSKYQTWRVVKSTKFFWFTNFNTSTCEFFRLYSTSCSDRRVLTGHEGTNELLKFSQLIKFRF